MAGSANNEGAPRPRLGKRLLWFIALWVAGVAAVGVLALLIRAALPA